MTDTNPTRPLPRSTATPRLGRSLGLLGAALWLLASPVARAAGPAEAPSVRWLADDAAGLAEARRTGRLVVVDFWADWCPACAIMERTTFSVPRVRSALREVVAVRLDGSAGSPGQEAFELAAGRWNVQGLPTVLLLDPRGRLVDRIEGVTRPGDFLERLRAGQARCAATLACR